MIRFIPSLIAATALATPALAKGPIDAIFPSDGSCYLRHYDRAHMSRHQDQLVTEIAIGPYAPEWGRQDHVAITLMVSVRGTDEFFVSYSVCQEDSGALSCQMEGDAGSFSLHADAGGKVRLEVSRRGMNFEGQSGFISISGTRGDDRVFLLPPVPADSCP